MDEVCTQGSAHISCPDTGPAQMVPEHSPAALALLLPTLQMAGEAGEGRGRPCPAPAACTLELEAGLGRPQESPSPTLHTYSPPSKPSLLPSPSSLMMGRRGECQHWLVGGGLSVNPHGTL